MVESARHGNRRRFPVASQTMSLARRWVPGPFLELPCMCSHARLGGTTICPLGLPIFSLWLHSFVPTPHCIRVGITPSVLGLLTERVLDLPSLRSGTGGCRRENETRGTQVCAMRKGAWGRMIDQSFGLSTSLLPPASGRKGEDQESFSV